TAAAVGAIGKGVFLPEVGTDYDGAVRPSTGPTDVGADEYVGTSSPSVQPSSTPPPTSTPPTASAGPNLTGNEGSPIAFTGTASGGTGTLSYSWTFGDGGTSTGTLTPTHTYADNGTYTATLKVTDANGLSSQSTTTVTVANVAPTANLGG